MRRLALVLIAACSGKSEHHAKSEPPRPAPAPYALPGEADHAAPARPDETRPPVVNTTPHASHPIEVTLRSSPPGATAAVDGTPVGPTPAFWGGDADGHEHEFTFELHGYALARDRFVPITSGVVHARLEPITEETDAGVSPETAVPAAGAVLVNPPPAATPPDAVVAPAAPVIVPPDVAPVPVDAGAMGPQP